MIEVDLAANAKLLPHVLAPNGVVAIYGSSAPELPIPFQFLLQNSITLKFFLVYEMRQGNARTGNRRASPHARARRAYAHVAQTFELDDIVAAHEMVESGKAIGNVIVRIS